MIFKKLSDKALAIIFIATGLSACEPTPESRGISDQNLSQASLKVWGNCEMCQETIEGSLKTKGVGSASWNSESKILEVRYDSTIISLDQIHKRVSASGYDTERYRADEDSYKNLHECCQYERRP